LLNANGDVVSAMLITEFRKGRSGFQNTTSRKFLSNKSSLLLRNVFIGSCLNTILSFNYYVINK
jgi:hypothetical protein